MLLAKQSSGDWWLTIWWIVGWTKSCFFFVFPFGLLEFLVSCWGCIKSICMSRCWKLKCLAVRWELWNSLVDWFSWLSNVGWWVIRVTVEMGVQFNTLQHRLEYIKFVDIGNVFSEIEQNLEQKLFIREEHCIAQLFTLKPHLINKRNGLRLGNRVNYYDKECQWPLGIHFLAFLVICCFWISLLYSQNF